MVLKSTVEVGEHGCVVGSTAGARVGICFMFHRFIFHLQGGVRVAGKWRCVVFRGRQYPPTLAPEKQ